MISSERRDTAVSTSSGVWGLWVWNPDCSSRKDRRRKSVVRRPWWQVFEKSATSTTTGSWSKARVKKYFRITKISRIPEPWFRFAWNNAWQSGFLTVKRRRSWVATPATRWKEMPLWVATLTKKSPRTTELETNQLRRRVVEGKFRAVKESCPVAGYSFRPCGDEVWLFWAFAFGKRVTSHAELTNEVESTIVLGMAACSDVGHFYFRNEEGSGRRRTWMQIWSCGNSSPESRHFDTSLYTALASCYWN